MKDSKKTQLSWKLKVWVAFFEWRLACVLFVYFFAIQVKVNLGVSLIVWLTNLQRLTNSWHLYNTNECRSGGGEGWKPVETWNQIKSFKAWVKSLKLTHVWNEPLHWKEVTRSEGNQKTCLPQHNLLFFSVVVFNRGLTDTL